MVEQNTYTEPSREIPITKRYDVIVAGGSQSGVAAAICAARQGAKVLLVERNCFLGGQSVGTLVVQWEIRSFVNKLGAVCTRGIAQEMRERIIAKGNSDTLWEDPPSYPDMRDGEEWMDVEAIKFTLLEMTLDAGVDILFDTLVVDAIVEESGAPKVTGIIVENKSGRQAIKGKVIIDATAYLDIVWHSIGSKGVIIHDVKDRMSPGWYTLFGGVDTEKFVEWMLESKICSGYPSLADKDKVWHHFNTERLLLYRGFADILDQAFDKGILEDWPEQRAMPFRLLAKWWGKDRWATCLDPFREQDALDAWDLSQAEIDRQKMDWILYKIFKLMPGWENSYITRTSVRLGLRETRVLKAVTMLDRDDIFNPDHDREDTVGRSGGHDPGKNKLWKAYPIPYGIMVPETLDGVLACTRTVGAADRTALDAHRGIVPTIVVGQAAGTAAGLAVKRGVQPRNVDVKELQSILRKDGVVLDVETIDLDSIPDRYLKEKPEE